MSILPATPSILPPWTDEAINLLKPALGVMARPIIVNNIARVAKDTARLTSAEAPIFVEKVQLGIRTFAGASQASLLSAQLAALLSARR